MSKPETGSAARRDGAVGTGGAGGCVSRPGTIGESLAVWVDRADDGPFMRLPLLIWRFLFADLLRLGILSGGGLVSVMAFALMIKFLADGRVDLAGGLRLMTLAMAPMLQYALPFAGGFAATLAYHRLASDNEASAAMAGGVGHRGLLAPALLAGLLTGAALLGLSQQVIPRFLRAMEETITRDLTGAFVRTIERGESVQIGNWVLHAKEIVRAGPDSSVGALERLRLKQTLAVQLDDKGNAQGSVTAQEVDVWLFEDTSADEPATVAQFVFRAYTAEGSVDFFRGERGASQRIRIPSAFVDDPKFLTYGELKDLREFPERINRVESLRRTLAMRMAHRRALENVHDRLRSEGRAVLERGAEEYVALTAGGLRAEGDRWVILPPAGTTGQGRHIRIEHKLESGSVFIHSARSAYLALESPGDEGVMPSDQATLRLQAVDTATSDDQNRTAPTVRERITLTNLASVGSAVGGELSMGANALLESTQVALGQGDALGMRQMIADAYRRLKYRVDSLQREVTGKQHERVAYSLASVVTLLCGAVVALRRQSALPLPVYLWSFFPALGAVITINAGQGLTRAAGPVGLILLWGGLAFLTGYTMLEYLRYRKH